MPCQGICIGFISGKGGTGKTTLLAGIGAALARMGRRTLCVDCVTGLRNLELALGLTEQSLMDFTDVAAGRATLEEAAAEHPAQPGLFLLNAPALNEEPIAQAQMKALAAHIRSHFDFCLLDAPPGIGDGFSLVTSAADRLLLVAQLDPLSCRDAQRTVMELDAFPPDAVHLIVNRVKRFPFQQSEITADDLMDCAGLPLIGVVPDDSAVTLALEHATPVTLSAPGSAASRACHNIARRLNGEVVSLPRSCR